jgi:hypothetical protein
MANKETPINFAQESPKAEPANPEAPKPADDKKHDQKTAPAQPVKAEATNP